MEITYFVLGMLSIISAVAVGAMIWGIVKINKQQHWLISIQREIDERDREIHKRMDEHNINTNRRIDELHSYIDSRIDKTLSTIGDKKLIKG